MKWFLLFNFLISSCAMHCAEIQDDEALAKDKLKKLNASIDKVKPQISKTDKEFQQKLSDLKTKQLQKIINFIPGFKIALKRFFEHEQQQAHKNQKKKKIQDEVIKRTKRLQNDYAQLVTQELIDALAQLGNYFSIETVDPENKKEFIVVIKDAKSAHDDIYESVTSYKDQAKNILGPLLAFAELSPSPYRLWYEIYKSALEHDTVLEKFVEVVQPLLEENNTTNLENHVTKAKQTYGFLQTQWKSYAQKVNMLFANLLTSAQQEQELKILLNRIFVAKTNVEQLLLKLMSDLSAVNMYGSFIPSLDFVDQWVKLVGDTQKVMDQWSKTSKEWQNKFNKLVERHQSVYDYLTKRKIMSDIQKSFSLEDDVIKKDSALFAKAQKLLVAQKSALQAKKSTVQASG